MKHHIILAKNVRISWIPIAVQEFIPLFSGNPTTASQQSKKQQLPAQIFAMNLLGVKQFCPIRQT